MIRQILQTIFIFTTITSVQAVDDDSNDLCVYQCSDGYPNSCNAVNVLCADYSLNPNNETEQCPLYGTHTFSSEKACTSFQAAESHSLYCLYKCNDTDFPNECLPKGQVCASTDPNTGCPLYHAPVIFNGVSECEDFREKGWSIEDCISCCHLADKVSERWSEIIDDGCGMVYNTVMFGASVGIGAVGTPAAAAAFDVFMIGVDGVTAVFSKKHDGLGDMICSAVGDASSESIAREKAESVCGDFLGGCSDLCDITSQPFIKNSFFFVIFVVLFQFC
eukprot:478074_1